MTHIDTFEPLWEALLYGTCTHAVTSILLTAALLDLLFCWQWFILKAIPKCTISILALTEVIPYRWLLTIKLSINALLLLPQTGSFSLHQPELWMNWFMSQSHFAVFLYVGCKPLTANAWTISQIKTLGATHISITLGLIESLWKISAHLGIAVSPIAAVVNDRGLGLFYLKFIRRELGRGHCRAAITLCTASIVVWR